MAGEAIQTIHEQMLARVAKALGTELTQQVAFVGGCATALLVTDDFTRLAVRFTDDVDVIVQVIGKGQWYVLEKELRSRGFRISQDDEILCRMRLKDEWPSELIVDFMPDDADILGFSNRWYEDALRTSVAYELPNGTSIRVVSAPFFLGTKFEAFSGRGNRDPLGSRDIEDILNVIDGRDSLLREVSESPFPLRQYIAESVLDLLEHRDFEYAVQSCARGDKNREELIFHRLGTLSEVE